jgi:hypothetical protein
MSDYPIDVAKIIENPTFTEKYLEEGRRVLNDWFIFGSHSDGSVDVADQYGDIFVNVPKNLARELVDLRHRFIHGCFHALRSSSF